MADVFISYSHRDFALAEKIAERLVESGLSVWIDTQIGGGRLFTEEIEKELKSAGSVLVLWTKDSINSHWVREEAMIALDAGKLLPVLHGAIEPPIGFRQVQFVDFSHWNGRTTDANFERLLTAIRQEHREDPGEAVHYATHGGGGLLSRRNLLLGAGGTLVAAGGGYALWNSRLMTSAAPAKSIAVLPFRNLSGDPGQDYFSAGLAEELRVILSLNQQLQVAAEASSKIFEAQEDSATSIASKLGVAYLLEGAVRRAAGTVRLTCSLIDGATGFEVWAQALEGGGEDVLALHHDLAAAIVDALFAQSDSGLRIIERPGGTDNSEALDHYLHGLSLLRLSSGEQTDREALLELEQAIAIDPGYAVAHAVYGWALIIVGGAYESGKALADFKRRAAEQAQMAIELAPNAPEGHAALGQILVSAQLNLRAAREPMQASFDLGFGNAQILASYAQYMAYIGEFEQARTAMVRTERLDPLNAQTFRTEAIIEYFARSMDAAQGAARSALQLNPAMGVAWAILGDIALLENDFARARECFAQEPLELDRLRGLAICDHHLAGGARGRELLDQIIAQFGNNGLYQQALVLAQWGESEAALAALERGLDLGDTGLPQAGVEPLLDPIRHEPRFEAIMTRIGLA